MGPNSYRSAGSLSSSFTSAVAMALGRRVLHALRGGDPQKLQTRGEHDAHRVSQREARRAELGVRLVNHALVAVLVAERVPAAELDGDVNEVPGDEGWLVLL